MKFLKKDHTGAIAPEFRRYSAPPMPKVSPCKEDDFPNYDTLRETARFVHDSERKKSYDNLIHNISTYMKDSAEDGYFEISMILSQTDYPGLDISKQDSVDCQDVRDYITAKDSRYIVMFEPLSDFVRVSCGQGVTLIVRWGDTDENSEYC